ncbi:carbohydrate kinase family protein [Maribellus sediminis]|uniref:carbohydrate kinase family protein n=1 Tax=Maribellus sediminis TaxID=2696285 RepID=UPI0014312C86|nr:carbohydrate kinase [Maribellus sediminis]
MKIKNNHILCFGEVLWDRLPTGAKPGGAPMNVALHLHAAGMNASIASCVGNDEAGNQLLSFLQNSGLQTNLIQIDKNLPTSEVLVHLDAKNNATYEICEPVAWDNIILSKALRNKVEHSGLLVYGSLAARNPVTRETLLQLRNTDVVKLMDVNLRPPYDMPEVVELLIHKSDIVKLNDDELKRIASWNKLKGSEAELVEWLSNHYDLKLLCVTRGANGALLYSNNTFYNHSGYKIKTVDTVGAGDAFLSGLIAALLKELEPSNALELACATGAFVASKAGATPKYDTDEIEQIMKQDYEK